MATTVRSSNDSKPQHGVRWSNGYRFDAAEQNWPQGLHPVPDGYLRTDGRGVIVDANDAATALLHCARPFLIGKPLGLLLTENSRPAFYALLARAPTSNERHMLEVMVGRRGAPVRDVIAIVERVTIEDGPLIGYHWLLRDVTRTRRVEQALRAERELLDGVISAAQAIILVVDAHGHVLRSNPFLHQISGFTGQELEGRPWDEVLLLPVALPAARRLIRDALKAGVSQTGALVLTTRDGRQRDILWSARSLPDEVPGSLVLVGHDVTELQTAQHQALQAERLATIGQVTAGLAHESRNALQRIQACLSMMTLRLNDQPEIRDLVERAQKAQDDLRHLFDDVLGYASQREPDRTLCDMSSIWRDTWTDLGLHPDQAELHEVLGGEETNLNCEVDRHQLRRVFRNLFENALAAGTPPVCVEVHSRPTVLNGRPALQLRVHDNGPGFPPGQAHKLFEPFFTTKTHGTGLGLAICRRIIDAHGGRIEARQQGPGAAIVLTVPRRSQ